MNKKLGKLYSGDSDPVTTYIIQDNSLIHPTEFLGCTSYATHCASLENIVLSKADKHSASQILWPDRRGV